MRPYYQDDAVTIYHGDCLDVMPNLSSCADMVLVDPPYGTTKCHWDIVVPLDQMWSCLDGRVKANGATLIFGSEPFSSMVRVSNIRNYRYDWVWSKTNPTGFFNAKKMPLKSHELISVFYQKLPSFYPQKTKTNRSDIGRTRTNSQSKKDGKSLWGRCGEKTEYLYVEDGTRFPKSVIEFSNFNGALFGNTSSANQHPTQKPIDLIMYLIATYTKHGEHILDFCSGSGTTGRAAKDLGRKATLIEREERYCEIAASRMAQEVLPLEYRDNTKDHRTE